MAIAAVGIIGAMGMAVDVGRAFIAKNETQAFCDAAALSAGLKLDGTSTGIANAKTAIASSTNSWHMDSTAVPAPTVDFATASSGPWITTPSPATGYTYVRVQSSVSLPFYFAPILIGWFSQGARYTQTINTAAVAAQIPVTSFKRGLAPYTAVSTTPLAPNFGLVPGNEYDIQWPAYNGTKFVHNPCPGDSAATLAAVQANWGASLSGYWGDNANSIIYQEVLDAIQLTPISIGQNITPILTSGNKAAQASALDTRVQQDAAFGDKSLGAYLSNSHHNGRRLLALPVVNPTDPTTTTVVGYASFLLETDGTSSSSLYTKLTGNDPYCAIYVGPYVQGATGSGGGSAGAYRVVLVQ